MQKIKKYYLINAAAAHPGFRTYIEYFRTQFKYISNYTWFKFTFTRNKSTYTWFKYFHACFK